MKYLGLLLCVPYIVVLANSIRMIIKGETLAICYRGATVCLCDLRIVFLSGGLLYMGLYFIFLSSL